MRILHLCLACFYIDGYNYQENVLPRFNKADGNEVRIIASTETYIDNFNLGYIEPCSYKNEDGIFVKRLPYKKFGNKTVTTKIRKYINLYEEIENFKPDVIMAHDLTFLSVLDVIKYIKKHKNVKFYADTHTSAANSGTNWVSINILHRIFYRYLVKKAEPYLDKYFYIGRDEKEFSVRNYNTDPKIMEFYPLGGVILKSDQYENKRRCIRNMLNLKDEDLLFVHSGKLTKEKRTVDLIKAFSSVSELNAKLVIIGSIPKDRNEELMSLINNDTRIEYLGWKTSEQLIDYLCACDIYCQPGSVSATLQNAICCNNPVIAYKHDTYIDYDYGNILWIETEKDIENVFHQINNGEIKLEKMVENASKCAMQLLDYKILARRLCE